MAQRATKHGVHQMMVGEWRKQAMEGTARAFSGKEAAQEQDVARSSEAPKWRDRTRRSGSFWWSGTS